MKTTRSICLFVLTLILVMSLGRSALKQFSPGVQLAGDPSSSTHTVASQAEPALRTRISKTYGQLPLHFEANQGQSDSAVKFRARGNGYQIYLTATEAVLQLRNANLGLQNGKITGSAKVNQLSSASVRMKLVGANPASPIAGRETLPGKSNYFIGNGPAKWRTDVPNYAKVEYEQVWPGVDLVYYGNQQQLEYDFVVAPGADPRLIKLAFEGAERVQVNAQGELVLRVTGGEVAMHKPIVYQQVNGARQEIAGGYVVEGRQARFRLGEYDASLPLVIDPVLSYSTYLGGSNTDRGISVAVDSTGKIYLAGHTFSMDFPRTVGPSGLKGGLDSFVTKLDPAKAGAESLIYSTYVGGSADDAVVDIAVDASGRAVVGGSTQSSDFPTQGPADPYRGRTDVFLLRLNAAGSALEYSTYLGDISDELLGGLALDTAGNAYVTGTTAGTQSFPRTVALGFGIPNRADSFITKFNLSGARVYSAVFFGNSSAQLVFRDIAVDSAGNAYVTGNTSGAFFPDAQRVGPLEVQANPVLVAKLNAAGTALAYFTFLGGTAGASASGQAIAVDTAGSAYVTGRTSSTNFPVVNPAQATLGGQGDAFVAKFNTAGNALLYATYLGGSGLEGVGGSGAGIAVDTQGSAYVTGNTDSPNFPNPNAVQPTFGGGTSDAFVTNLSPTGSTFVYSTYLGGNGVELGNAIAVDSTGNAYIAGTTTSANFPTKDALQPNARSAIDAFVAKISNGQPQPTPTPASSPATVRVENATKNCVPTDAYPRIPAQPAAGPNFAAIPEQTPTQIKCTFEAEVVLDGISGNTGPVNLIIFDGFSPGLFFDRLTASSPTLTVGSYTGNVLTFNQIQLALPPQTVFQRFRINFEYFAFLNDLAEQRTPQQNCITLRFTDPRTGGQIAEKGDICANTEVLVPRLSLEKYASSTTGLPGDTLKFTVIALNGGNIFLQTVDIDALIPNNTTLVPGSVEPPPTRVIGNRIEWRGLGPLNAGGALPVNYAVTINSGTPENTKLVDQAFAQATTPNFAGAGTRRLNAASNQVTVMVMALRTGIDLTLTPTPSSGCPLSIINYTAKVTNTGQVSLDRLRLTLNPGTEPVAGNPTFPLQLDPLGPGESRTIGYKGQLGLKQKGVLVDVAYVSGRPVNNGVQVAELVGKVATANVQVSPPAISKITPASGPPGSSNLELKIEGACFVPQTVVSFQSNSGITVIDPTPPDFGFIGTSELRRRINIRADAVPGEREIFVTNPSGDSGGQRPFNIFTVPGATAAIDAAPTSLDFASIPTGQSKNLTLTVRNTGQAGLTINPSASSNPRFMVIAPALPLTIAAGAQQVVTVRFAPTVAGAQTGTLTINSNAANRPSLAITLSGTGIGTPDIAVSPSTLDFGSAPLGQTVTKLLTFNNPGNTPLDIYAVTSSNPSFRARLTVPPLTLPAGTTLSLTVSFTPTSAGVQTGTLLIASNAANKNTLAVQAIGGTLGETLTTDDGTVETGALADGLLIVNRLTPARYPITLRSLRIFFAQFQGVPSPAGEQIRLVAFADPTGSGQPPANPTLLVNQLVTIPAIPANGDFVDFPITAPTVAEGETRAIPRSLAIESGDIYVGFQAPRPARGVVFAADSSGPQQQRAFFSTNDGASYAKLTGLQGQSGTLTPVNVMLQAGIGGIGVCTYAINPGSQVFSETGGSGTVTVTAPSGCSWAASSNSDWITFPPNSSGNGNGTVILSVAASVAPRQAVVTIAGQSFIVAQAERVASVSSASYRRLGLAGEAIAAAYGTTLATSIQGATSVPLPTSLAGTTVKVRDATGMELFAPLFFVSPDQVNFLMPPGLAPGTATVSVTNSSGATALGAVLNDVVAPGLFTANADGQGVPAAIALRVKANGTQLFEPVGHFDSQQNRFVALPLELGPPGEQVYLLLFGTGLRGRSSLAAATVLLGGVAAQVAYAGGQGDLIGLDQVNLAIPRTLIGRGEVDLVLSVDGKTANIVRVNIQ